MTLKKGRTLPMAVGKRFLIHQLSGSPEYSEETNRLLFGDRFPNAAAALEALRESPGEVICSGHQEGCGLLMTEDEYREHMATVHGYTPRRCRS